MTRAIVAAICRHPVKSLGEEALRTVTLEPGRAMPFDRVWAVTHGGTEFTRANPRWVRARNFVTQTHVPELARIVVRFDEAAGRLTLSHPLLGELTVAPATPAGGEALTEWLAPVAAPLRPGPWRLVRLPDGAFTDFPDCHLHIASLSSLAALGQVAGRALERIRFRANLWLDGLAPWEEFDLVGREIAVGGARLRITERTTRCNATAASPSSGRRDTPVPEILAERWGHGDFGVYAQVVAGGAVAVGDPVRLAP